MRKSSLRDIFAAAGASFGERYGIEIVTNVKDNKTEYHYIRDTAGLTDFSHMQMYRVPEETGLDYLDSIMTGNVAKIRFGRILHTCLTNPEGMILADCYVANNDDEFIVLCESIVDDAAIRSVMLGDESSGIEDCTGLQTVISVDGYKSWAVVKELFGADVLGLPYLSIEAYSFENTPVRLFRAGKTSEFGYLLSIASESAQSLVTTLAELVKKQGGGLCGVNIHSDLRLEGRFFNIYAEGKTVKDPLELGLQWMIDFDKESFIGHDALAERRSKGLVRKIIGVSTAANVTINQSDPVFSDGKQVGEVQCSCFSYVLNRNVGLALFDIDLAYAGLQFSLHSAGGPEITTISMPPIMPKSLSVKLDEI